MTEEASKSNLYLALGLKYLYKYFLFFGLFLFIITGFLCYNFILRTKHQSINDNIKQSVEARREYKETLDNYRQRLAGYNQAYQGVPLASRQKVEAFFNFGQEQEILFSQFEAIAKNQGVVLNSLLLRPEGGARSDEVRGLATIRFTAAFIGLDYRTLKNFLAYMENVLPLINITNLKFTDGEGVTIEGETYYLN